MCCSNVPGLKLILWIEPLVQCTTCGFRMAWKLSPFTTCGVQLAELKMVWKPQMAPPRDHLSLSPQRDLGPDNPHLVPDVVSSWSCSVLKWHLLKGFHSTFSLSTPIHLLNSFLTFWLFSQFWVQRLREGHTASFLLVTNLPCQLHLI